MSKCKHGESWIACQVCSDLCDHGEFWRDCPQCSPVRLANALLCIEDISMNCMPCQEDETKLTESDKAVSDIYLVAHGARGCCENCPSAKQGVEIAESFRENEEKDAEERKKRNAIEWDGKIEHSEL